MGRLDYPNLEIVVSDNGSTDGTLEEVRAKHPDATILDNGNNLFWAGGNNEGIKYAMANAADYIFLLNNDIVVDPRLVSELVEVGESDPSVGMLGPKIYYHDPGDVIWFAGAEIHLWRGVIKHLGIREKDRGQYDEMKPTDYVTGCALMVKREVVERIGLIDPVYLAYCEDVDWSYRARLAGYKLMYVPTAVLWHKIGGYWGSVTKRKIKQKLRSLGIFFWRYSPKPAWISTLPLFFGLDALRIIFNILSGRIRNT
jgi:hypothetical protein